MDALTGISAVLLGRRNDVLAWNRLGHALFAGHLPFGAPQDPAARPNLTRMLFLDPHTRELYRDWNDEAALLVASLRFVAAQYPDDRALAELVGELSVKSTEFAGLWAKHTVQLCSSGTKHIHHPEIGDLDIDYEALHLPDTDGQRLIIHTAARGSSSAHALSLLARTPDGRETNGNSMARPMAGLGQRREAWTVPAGGAEHVCHVAQVGEVEPRDVEHAGAPLTNYIDAVTLAALAGRLGVKPPALYKHVDGLGDLRHRIAALAMSEFGDELRGALQGKSGLDALTALFTVLRSYATRHPGRYTSTTGAEFTGPDDPLLTASTRVMGSISAVLSGYGIPSGERDHAIRSLRCMAHGFALLQAASGFQWPAIPRKASPG